MESITLSRSEYDTLVTDCPNWVEANWPRFSKQWGLVGVTLTGKPSDVENLRCQL